MPSSDMREGQHEDVSRGFEDSGADHCQESTSDANSEFAVSLLNQLWVTPIDS
jgi:hypothetical protein